MRHVLSDLSEIGAHDIILHLEASVTNIAVMRRDYYDADDDGIVDKASGIPVLDEVPTDLSSFSNGDMFKVGQKTYIVDGE